MRGSIIVICLLLLAHPFRAPASDLARIFLPLRLKNEIKLPDEIIKIPVVAEGKLFYAVR